MALIYRAIFEVDGDDVIVLSRRSAEEWARNKLERPELELSLGERFADEKRGVELHSIDVSTGESAVFRFVLFENRAGDNEHVRTTFSTLVDGSSVDDLVDRELFDVRWPLHLHP